MYGYGHGYDHMGWMAGGWLLMALTWLVPVGLVAALVFYLLRGVKPGATTRTPLDIVEEAYARGEISREEFLQKREDLQRK